ncbi:hypothetical protein F4779DRAFT_189321 [Xylariaceae sp. FL0662B]|nr:hypothetical protein F4779DRAFT_189321 [Xylariaceae sp. FL0662B]
MHLPLTTVLPSTLLSLLLFSRWTLVKATSVHSVYLRESAHRLSEAAACGDKDSLRNCFQIASQELTESSDLAQCFQSAGCTLAESVIEANFIIKNYGDGKSAAELRRRGPDPMPAPTPAPIPQDDAAATTAATTSASLECSTTSTVKSTTCPIESTGAQSGKKQPCTTTMVPTLVCDAANICMKDNQGANVCMRRRNTLDTGGLVVTIILAICFGVGAATLLFLCCKDKRQQRRLQARKEAAAIAKNAALNKEVVAPMRIPSGSEAGHAPPPHNPFS